MAYSGARGTLIYEKNLKSKISCQTPFNTLKIPSLSKHEFCSNCISVERGGGGGIQGTNSAMLCSLSPYLLMFLEPRNQFRGIYSAK
jgi:hypothetical protein